MRMKEILPGIYRHYKGGIYEVLALASHSETLEDMVVYRSITEDKYWVRPAVMWDEVIEKNGGQVSRFTWIANSLDDMDSRKLFRTIERIVAQWEMYDRLSDRNALVYCEKSSGDVWVFPPEIGACMDGDIGESELDENALSFLPKIQKIMDFSDNYVRVPTDGFPDEYSLMSDFASLFPLPYSEKLEQSLQGKGAFRRFKDMLRRLDLAEEWYRYRDMRYRREVREWCDVMDVAWINSYDS